MSWLFGKKEKKEEKKQVSEMPELPELPELPPLPKELESKSQFTERPGLKNELPPLPAFPSSSTGKKISNEAVKQIIREPSIEPQIISKPRTREIEGAEIPARKQEPKVSIEAEPVFVRIDKYQKSLTKFQEIKKKILEIENLLRDIKEIKSREEAELHEWEAEIQTAKEKINDIDKTIFSKVD